MGGDSDNQGFSLSPQQQHIWLLQQVDGPKAYRSACSVQIDGPLDASRLRKCLLEIAQRYEILRTIVSESNTSSQPVQIIDDEAAIDFAELELSDPSRAVLNLSAPSIILDGRSLKLLVREIAECYEGLSRSPSSSEVAQFADLAEWQNELLHVEEAHTGNEYWQSQIKQNAADLRLPLEQQQGSRGFKPNFVATTLGELGPKLNDIAARYETTLPLLLFACWQVYCWRITEKPDDNVIGVLCDGRTHEELSDVLGPFEKYLPIASRLLTDQPFAALVRQLEQTMKEAVAWQEVFSPELAQMKQNEQPFYIPLCFSFQTAPEDFAVGPLTFSTLREYCCSDRFKLKLSCRSASSIEFHYDANHFNRNNVELFSQQFQTLLQSVAENPEKAIGELRILPDDQLNHLVYELNHTAADYGPYENFCQLWSDAAGKFAGETAVIYQDQQLTYGELEQNSDRLARALRSLGVKNETIVPIYVERSIEMVTAALAVLKAGAAFAPLDPAWPLERVQFILDDLHSPVLLTQQKLSERLSARSERIVELDVAPEVVAEDAVRATETLDRNNLAYVIYTSGSTGKPKGVMVTHGGFVNYLLWANSYYQPRAGSQSIVHSPFSSDLAITSVFLPLLSGGTLRLIPENQALDGLVNVVSEENDFSLLKLTPSHLKFLSQQPTDRGAKSRVHSLIVGGEALYAESLTYWKRQHPATRVVNEYGPTETVVGSCAYEVSANWPDAGPVPIGRPIGNTESYVLDEFQEPVPLGVVGELYLGGSGVARGYLQRPDLTAERFIPDRFSGRTGARLYRTGDLVRYREDGELTFAGRADQQVKVRGYRVELGEIETVLSEHASVGQVAVVLREDKPGEPRLASYVTAAKSGVEPDTDDLRQYLKQRVPEYMVPASIMVLAQLPLSPNGKLDRRQLPTPEPPRRVQQYVAPRTELEEELVKIWQEVLSLNRVGVEDNFFDLGGHSLVATQMVSRVRARCKVELSLQSIFQHPTIASLAIHVMQSQFERLKPDEAMRLLEEIDTTKVSENVTVQY
jgi:amino acid adenylation domain-containing protein